MVDQFVMAEGDPAVLLFGGQRGGEVEQPGGVTLVRYGSPPRVPISELGGPSRIWVVAP